MDKDLTIIYLTINKMPEKWADFHMKHLLKSTKGFPIISISRIPMNIGKNLIQDVAEPSQWNLNMQVLRGALLAETPYVAIAEDDSLYTKEHFTEFRPPLDTVAFDMSRWSIFGWSPKVYHMLQNRGGFAMLGSRELFVDIYSERKEKYPNGYHGPMGEPGRLKVERVLGVKHRKAVEFYSTNPIVNLCHNGLSSGKPGRGRKKRPGRMQAYDIPYWGKAEDLIKYYG